MWKGQAPRGYNGVRWNYMEYLVEINKKKKRQKILYKGMTPKTL